MSPEPFRYLGFYMIYTIQQRNYIQVRLLTTVDDQVRIYSARHPSLRGRATVMNTLIMTKIWYCMRLINPTQAFISKLKYTTYKYVWQQKHPLVSFSQLSLPLSQGGVGLLHPGTQSLVLQIRHLRHVFYNRNTSILVQSFVKAHLSMITPDPLTFEASFFITEWHKHDLNHPTSIINNCYKAFDHFQVQKDFSKCSIHAILLLPLHYLILTHPIKHWLQKHRNFTANKFLIYDSQLTRLRIRNEREFENLPQLCRRLKKEILELQTVKLQPFLFPYIVQDVDEENNLTVNFNPLTKQFRTNNMWLKYTSSVFRVFNVIESVTIFSDIDYNTFKTFWSLPLLLQARTHWHRVLSKKLPIAPYLQLIGKLSSSQCRLCQLATEH